MKIIWWYKPRHNSSFPSLLPCPLPLVPISLPFVLFITQTIYLISQPVHLQMQILTRLSHVTDVFLLCLHHVFIPQPPQVEPGDKINKLVEMGL